MLREQVQFYLTAALPVSFHDLINDFFTLCRTVLKIKFHQLCIGLLCHIIQADLFDLQRIADGLDSGQRAVKLRQYRINGSCLQNCFTGIIVSRMTVKDLGVMASAKLKILAHTGAAHQLEALCSGCLCLCDSLRTL